MKVIHVVLFVLFILLSQFQPLKSRGIIPFLAFFRFFFSSFFHFNHFGNLQNLELSCYFQYFIDIPLTFSGFFLIVLSLFRYVVITNLNMRKQKITKTKTNEKNVLLIVLKYSIHPIVTLIIWVLIVIVFLIIDTSLVFSLRCETDLEGVTPYIANPLYGIVIFLCSILFFIDILMNLRKIFSKCGICNLFIKYDAYYFRTELYIFGLGIAATGFILVTILEISIPNLPFVVALLFGWMLDLMVFFFQSGFVLLMTIINLFLKLFRKKTKGYLIEQLLTNEEFHDMFYEFTKSEWSTENLVCYDDIIDFEKNGNKEKAEMMMNLYFNGASSELEVNVPGTLLVSIKENLQKNEIDKKMFNEIKNVVVSNLLDTNSRFIWTWEYRQFKFRNEAFGENVELK